MIDMKQAMLEALQGLPAATAERWEREEKTLPVIIVGDADRSVLATADGMPYLESYRGRVEVYAATLSQLDVLAAQADAALWALGLKKESDAPSYSEEACAYHRTMLYRAVLCGSWIYQEG